MRKRNNKFRLGVGIKIIVGLWVVALATQSCKIEHTPTTVQQLGTPGHLSGDSILNATTDTLLAATDTIANYKSFFSDSTLISLIDTALALNFDNKIALQRIQIAQTAVLAQSARLIPQVDATANLGATRFGKYTMDGVGNYDTNFSPNITDQQNIPNPMPGSYVGLQSSWQLDVWNKLRTAKAAEYERLLATKQAQQLIQTELIAQIATLYYELLGLDYKYSIIEKNINIQKFGLELISIQKSAGRVTELAVQQFKAQLLNTQSYKNVIEQQRIETENKLNLIIGRYPQPIKRPVHLRNQLLPKPARKGVQTNVLKNRPDIQMLYRQIRATDNDIFVAKANFYPNLTLTAGLGFDSFRPHLIFLPESIAFNVFSGLSAPIINRKELFANLNRVEAQQKINLLKYEQKLMEAYQEVISHLKGIENYTERYNLKKDQVASLNAAVSTANELFIVGFATYLEVVTAQKSVFEAELELANARKEQFIYAVNLYRALGGK